MKRTITKRRRSPSPAQEDLDHILFSSDSEDDETYTADNPAPIDDAESEEETVETPGPSAEAPGPSASTAQRRVAQEKPVFHEWVRVTDMEQDDLNELTGLSYYNLTCSAVGVDNYSPFQCFEKLFPGTMYEHVAAETNKYARERLDKMQPLSPRSMFHRWTDVTAADIRAFIALEIAWYTNLP